MIAGNENYCRAADPGALPICLSSRTGEEICDVMSCEGAYSK